MKGLLMLVREVMSSPAVTVRGDASLKEAISLLERHDVSAMPVVDGAGRLVGVVSEADVIRELVAPDQRTHEIPVRLTTAPLAQRVADVMTTHPITVGSETDLAVATELMTSSAIKSLPVVDHGRVAGVVSRRDVIRVLARPDLKIEAEVDELFRRAGRDWLVDVADGVVVVDGPSGEAERQLAEAMTRSVPGVVALRFRSGPP
jgi:CBS domain-containing protein